MSDNKDTLADVTRRWVAAHPPKFVPEPHWLENIPINICWRYNMRHINGVADAEKIQTSNESNYPVTVTDGNGLVVLNINAALYPAGLTPDRARYVAKCLIDSARRVEERNVAK